jgi:hypothetical protein
VFGNTSRGSNRSADPTNEGTHPYTSLLNGFYPGLCVAWQKRGHVNKASDRRDFDRFPIEFAIQVSAKDSSGKIHKEKTALQDISGEGARFITHYPDRYFQDQNLELVIYLPGTNEVKAQMWGKARVIRIGDSGNISEGGGTSIAVKLSTSLQFTRLGD